MLILTTFDLDEYVYAALKAGASGFILKDGPAEGLGDAVRTVAAGQSLLAPAITRRVIEEYVRRSASRSPDRSCGAHADPAGSRRPSRRSRPGSRTPR